MQYKAAFTKNFIKENRKLPKNIRKRILEAIKKASANPYGGTKLRAELHGLWRWRTGKYRVIYTINEQRKQITFLDVGLRKAVYK